MSIRKIGNDDLQHPISPKQPEKRLRINEVVQTHLRAAPINSATFNALANEALPPLFRPFSLPNFELAAIPEDPEDNVEDGMGKSKAHSIYSNAVKR